MKVAPLIDALHATSGIRQVLLNTGQHYDEALAGVFLKELSLPTPDRNLAVGSGSHAVQTAKVMIGFEEVCLEEKPDLVVVVGDVNSTVAAAFVAAKLGLPCAHVEAGLRSFDRTMPEEINRLVTDQLAEILLTPSPDADDNLRREGIPPERIHFVGNVMVDTLMRYRPVAGFERVAGRFGVRERGYAVLTLHRPSNVDDPASFVAIAAALQTIGETMPVVFPVHPRTRARIQAFGLGRTLDRVMLTEPLGYLDFLSLMSHAAVVLTDSGGMQEETTVLGIPCLTLRENTERPITLTEGTNRLVGTDTSAIIEGFKQALSQPPHGRIPQLWDGRASVRIVEVFRKFLFP
jgi:UDP-N-acetylglucosamine 2-epimerase (non-hydrolysing)